MKTKSKISQTQLTQEIFAPLRTSFPREKIIPKYIDECWSVDLIDKTNQGKFNDGYRYILSVIDNFSKFAWVVPLKDKQGTSITSSFQHIFRTSKRKPDRIWSDNGKEFYNHSFQQFLKLNNIHHYSTHSNLKAVFVERFNRTLQDLMKVPMYIEGKARWINHLSNAIQQYNKRKHGTIQMTPIEASKKENSGRVSRMFAQEVSEHSLRKKSQLAVGDFVRIPDKRNVFSKGYTTNWGWELFQVYKTHPTDPVTYLIKDEKGEIIQGRFYQPELLKSKYNYKTNREVLKSMNVSF